MTALELFGQLPEYPDQLRVRDKNGNEVLLSLHPTPLHKRPRLRTERNNRVGFASLEGGKRNEAIGLLALLEPYTLIGRERERIQADEMARKHV
ncbi:MAG: hypothetical protein SFU83_23540 [Meiothermus sp.]|nr:hypothetical protein [Meiothermus sp.]